MDMIVAVSHMFCITIYCGIHDTGCPNLGRRVILLGSLDQDIALCETLYNYVLYHLSVRARSTTTHYDNNERQCLDTEYSILLIHHLQ